MLDNLILKRLTTWLAPVLLWLLWEGWLRWERAAVEVIVVSLALAGAVLWYLTWRPVAISQLQQDLHRKEFWRFFITPGIFVLATDCFLLILENRWRQHLLILGASALFGLLLQNLFDRFYRSANYPISSLESISGNINSLSLFFLTAVLYGWATFLSLGAWLLALGLVATVTLLSYQTFWLAGLRLSRTWLYLVVINLLALEIFWTLWFLPNTFYVKALVVTAVYYLTINLSRNHLLGLLTKKMASRYLVVGGAVILVVLTTAQWL